jgi:hypothetical protein
MTPQLFDPIESFLLYTIVVMVFIFVVWMIGRWIQGG